MLKLDMSSLAISAQLLIERRGQKGDPQMATENKLIDQITADKTPHYEPYGWHHWPDHPWMAYQFRRGLGETQEGAGAVSECFQAAARMVPGDKESWHREWLKIADRNNSRGDAEEAAGHVRTAQNCWLRAAGYYRQAEFWLAGHDPRRLPTFEKMEACSRKFIKYLTPLGEVVDVPYEPGKPICAYFVRAPFAAAKQPVLICMGGLEFDQGRDVVHAGACPFAARHLGPDDRRAGPGRYPASP